MRIGDAWQQMSPEGEEAGEASGFAGRVRPWWSFHREPSIRKTKVNIRGENHVIIAMFSICGISCGTGGN